MKKIGLLMAGVVLAVSLTACATESTSTTTFNVTTTTDEGTTEYNYSSEYANGEFSSSEEYVEYNNDINCNIVDGVAYITAPYRTDLWCEEIVYVDDVEICAADAEEGVYYASNLPIIKDGVTKIFVAQYDEDEGDAFAYAVFTLSVKDGYFDTVEEAYVVDSINDMI